MNYFAEISAIRQGNRTSDDVEPRPRAYAGDDGVGEADWAASRVSVVRENVQPGGERSAAATTAATAAATTAAAANAAATVAKASSAHAFSTAKAEMLLWIFATWMILEIERKPPSQYLYLRNPNSIKIQFYHMCVRDFLQAQYWLEKNFKKF